MSQNFSAIPYSRETHADICARNFSPNGFFAAVTGTDHALFQFRPDRVVRALEIEKRSAFVYHDIFHLGNKDGVIARFVGSFQPAFQVGEGPAQYGSSMAGAIESGSSCLFRQRRIAFGQSVVL